MSQSSPHPLPGNYSHGISSFPSSKIHAFSPQARLADREIERLLEALASPVKIAIKKEALKYFPTLHPEASSNAGSPPSEPVQPSLHGITPDWTELGNEFRAAFCRIVLEGRKRQLVTFVSEVDDGIMRKAAKTRRPVTFMRDRFAREIQARFGDLPWWFALPLTPGSRHAPDQIWMLGAIALPHPRSESNEEAFEAALVATAGDVPATCRRDEPFPRIIKTAREELPELWPWLKLLDRFFEADLVAAPDSVIAEAVALYDAARLRAATRPRSPT